MRLFLLKGINRASSFLTQLTELKIGDIIGMISINVLEDLECVLLAELHVQVLKAHTELIE